MGGWSHGVCVYVRMWMCVRVRARSCAVGRSRRSPKSPTCGVAQVLHDVGGFFYVAYGREGTCSTTTAYSKITRPFSRAKTKGIVADDDADADAQMIQDRASSLLLESKIFDIRYAEGAARLGGHGVRG